jgi:hypothetical protein
LSVWPGLMEPAHNFRACFSPAMAIEELASPTASDPDQKRQRARCKRLECLPQILGLLLLELRLSHFSQKGLSPPIQH